MKKKLIQCATIVVMVGGGVLLVSVSYCLGSAHMVEKIYRLTRLCEQDACVAKPFFDTDKMNRIYPDKTPKC